MDGPAIRRFSFQQSTREFLRILLMCDSSGLRASDAARNEIERNLLVDRHRGVAMAAASAILFSRGKWKMQKI